MPLSSPWHSPWLAAGFQQGILGKRRAWQILQVVLDCGLGLGVSRFVAAVGAAHVLPLLSA